MLPMAPRHRALLLSLCACAALGASPATPGTKQTTKPAPGKAAAKPAAAVPVSAEKASAFKKIMESYVFVADFSDKNAQTRSVSEETFWPYPFRIPDIVFVPDFELDNIEREMPATRGKDREAEHINRGRVMYLQGDYEEAKGTWIAALTRFGKKYPHFRRLNYYVALNFLQQAHIEFDKTKDWNNALVKSHLSNASTFLSWAFVLRKDDPDPVVDAAAPKQLYNLAAIYYMYKRYSGAYGAAQSGLEYLRKTGRKEYRPQLTRVLAEAYIKNRSYLESVQEFDTAIRQDPNPAQAAAIFARVGDIYFDLGNYELADDAYQMASQIDEEMQQFTPQQMILRGESLFWMGKFSDAQKVMYYAINGASDRKMTQPATLEFKQWAQLRIADAYLARKMNAQAKLEYFRLTRDYKGSLAAKIASIRLACAELPFYEGNNIKHARELLEATKAESTADLPKEAIEISWACQVGSYAERERTKDMVDRVRVFAEKYPAAKFLHSLAEPVREVQAANIEPLLEAKDYYSSVSFFEKNRKTLFPKISDTLAQQMFVAYQDVYKPLKQREFWDGFAKVPTSDLKRLRQALAAAEISDKDKAAVWQKRNRELAADLTRQPLTLAADPAITTYLQRLLSAARGRTPHLPWIYSLAKTWGNKDNTITCDLQYPLLVTMYEMKAQNKSVNVNQEIAALVKAHLPAALKEKGGCGLSLLDLEAKATPAKELALRYAARTSWPVDESIIHYFWTAAESAKAAGNGKAAADLWTFISTKGPASAPEVAFAKARLDPAKTEFEKIWE